VERSETRGRRSRAEIYGLLDAEVDTLRNRLGGLPAPLEARDIWGTIWYQEAHNSTAIEGNTLVLREVEVLLRDGRAVGDKALADYLEVQGYGEAARWVYDRALEPGDWQTDKVVTLTEVRYIHQLVMTAVWDVAPHEHAGPGELPGSFRRHNIKPFPAGMSPPDWTEVPMRLDGWLDHVSELRSLTMPFPEALAQTHAEFEQIHPFIDGNGRTGRLLLNLILIRLEYPPTVIRAHDRLRYLRALRRADDGENGPLGEFLARSILDTLYRFIMPAVAGPVDLLPLAAFSDRDISTVALREAAVRGRLRAVRDDSGRWLTSRAWVDEYKSSRSRRGRPPVSRGQT
jgi:hypothetical protein